MLVKWVRCTVVDRPGFARAQRKWAGLLGEPGFRGQGGGWSRTQDGVAHLFGFWDSRAFYDSFMARSHDRLHASQAGTYKNAQVRLFEYRFDVKTGFSPVFTDADLLRVAHCRVRPDRAEHYVLMQEKVWNPAMAGSPGMLRGIFAQAHMESRSQRGDRSRTQAESGPRIGNQTRAQARPGSEQRTRSGAQADPEEEFLVLSMWDSAAEHGKYRPERVERLALRAQTGADITGVSGDVIDLEPGWTV